MMTVSEKLRNKDSSDKDMYYRLKKYFIAIDNDKTEEFWDEHERKKNKKHDIL